MRVMSVIAWSAAFGLAMASCTSSGHSQHSGPATAPAQHHGPTPVSSFTNALPHGCSVATLSVASAGIQSGVTGGGEAITIHLSARQPCSVAAEPGVMVLDAGDHLVSFASVRLPAQPLTIANSANI